MAVYIDEKLCKGCGLCLDYCPAGVLAMSSRRNQKGYYLAEVGNPDDCKICRSCEINCPDLAIFVEESH